MELDELLRTMESLSDGFYVLPGWDVHRMRKLLRQLVMADQCPAGYALVPLKATEEVPTSLCDSKNRANGGTRWVARRSDLEAMWSNAVAAAVTKEPQPDKANTIYHVGYNGKGKRGQAPTQVNPEVEFWKDLYRRAVNEANGLTNYVDDRPELRSAERRLTQIQLEARSRL